MKTQNMSERFIGSSVNGHIKPENFRATKAQSLIINNLNDLIESGRNSIKEQDILNISQDDLIKNSLTVSNIEGAFSILQNLKIIEADYDGNFSFSEAGNEIADMVRQQTEQEPEDDDTPDLNNPEGIGGEDINQEQPPQPEDLGSESGDLNLDFESFDFVNFLNQNSKFRKI